MVGEGENHIGKGAVQSLRIRAVSACITSWLKRTDFAPGLPLLLEWWPPLLKCIIFLRAMS
jgi:hypothetical protein